MKDQEQQTPPQKKNVALLWILSTITLNIYSAIWFIKKSRELNTLGTQKKLKETLTVIYLIITIVAIPILILLFVFSTLAITKPNLDYASIFTIIAIIYSIIALFILILVLFMSFCIRTIINETLTKKGVTKKISWFFTLIFNIFYLQYEINRIMENKEYEKRIGPWVCLGIIIALSLTSILINI